MDIDDPLASLRALAAAPDRARLDIMIGQMIMVGFAGRTERDPGVRIVRDELNRGAVGGVVLYPDNIGAKRQVKNLNAFLLNARSDPPPFIAVDQEGGLVQRLSRRKGWSYFPAAWTVGHRPLFAAPDGVLALYRRMAGELAEANFNVNFGPVLDLAVNPANPVIARRRRSFGTDPTLVTSLARAFIAAHRQANIVTVAKHFPGHGSSRSDSHRGFADISASWREVELEPYRQLAAEDMLDAVMIGHLYHPRFSDGGKLPASLSARAVHALRAQGYIGFNGMIVSDDLEMGAVRNAYPLDERVVRAINAGTDLVLLSNETSRDPKLGQKIHDIIARAVEDGRISSARIEDAYAHVMRVKQRLMQRTMEAAAP